VPKNIDQLKQLWKKERGEYRTQEIGSGVQKFCKEILKCPEIFDLKEGKLSTPDEKRKEEFLEEKAKKYKRADVIIYVDPQIIIPVEIEKHKNIKAGEEQLFSYQRVWEKKYGILTDGYEWQFFNNKYNIKTFTIDEIFKNPSIFREYWEEYIQPKNYYLQFFEKAGQLEFFEDDLTVDRERENFFSDITTLIKSFNNKLNIKGYFENISEEESEKKAVEITYAYLIQFILYKALVDNEFKQFNQEFEDRLERIHKDLKNESYGDILTVIKAISDLISVNIYRPFLKEQEFINEKLSEILTKPKNALPDVTPWLDIFVFIKRYNFANVRNEIFGYIYENYLKDLYTDEKKGQYFTHPDIVNFMLEQVGYDSAEIKKRFKENKDSISFIDPSCGSGTFLYSAVRNIIDAIPNGSQQASKTIEKLINDNIFGLDIAEFPLYLAEMSIIMRMLPLIINEKYNNPIDKKIKVFKTKDSVSEFLDTALRNTISDINIESKKNNNQLSLFTKKLNLGYDSYVRDEDDLRELKKSLENQTPKIDRYRFDFVVGNPPYVGYNDCSKQGLLITKLIQEKSQEMSNIYGVNLNTVPGRIKAYAPKPNLYAFFIALGLALLKDSGKLCYIIPQTILTAIDLDVIRYHLAKYTTIERIISFSGKMFIGRSIKQNKPIATSSLIFIVNRKNPAKLHKVEIVNYKDPDDDITKCLKNISNGEKVRKNKILQNRLLQNIANWSFIKYDKTTTNLFEYYNKQETLDVYRLEDNSKKYFKSLFYFDKGLVFPKKKISKSKNDDIDHNYFTLIEANTNRYNVIITENIIREKDIRLPKGAQGFKVYEKKYKVIWKYMNPKKFHFSNKNIMINHNWIIISSDNRNEMFYLLSLLNSKISYYVLTKLFKIENEKSFQIGIKSIKEYFRVPIINSFNQKIKDEIIIRTEELLKLEKYKLSDLVDFSKIMVQKYDNIAVEKNVLVLFKDNNKSKCKIKRDSALVEKIISETRDNGLFNKDKLLNLSDLENTAAIDFERQKVIKNYIDDLVFALYFNIKLINIGVEYAAKIKLSCQNNKYYKTINIEP